MKLVEIIKNVYHEYNYKMFNAANFQCIEIGKIKFPNELYESDLLNDFHVLVSTVLK